MVALFVIPSVVLEILAIWLSLKSREVKLGRCHSTRFRVVNFGGSFGHILHSHCLSSVMHVSDMRHVVAKACRWWCGMTNVEVNWALECISELDIIVC